MSEKDGVYYNALYAEYSALLTENQREAFDMTYGLDLSLGEIAEIKGVSKQSVADALAASKKQLVQYEEKLGLARKRSEMLAAMETLSGDGLKTALKKILGED